MDVPVSLRRWFVAHFVVDLLVGLPLLFFPETFLGSLGWTLVEPTTTRLVGAALVAIGAQSYIGRNEGADVFRVMLNLNILWSMAAITALFAGIATGAPPPAWALLSGFIALLGVWVHYRIRMKQLARAQDHDDLNGDALDDALEEADDGNGPESAPTAPPA